MAHKTLRNAKTQQKDEFYTQLADIEKECSKYKEAFRDKTIFLNCDDPLESNFWKYFALNFTHFGLKKLIATHFDETEPSYKLELTGDMDADGTINDDDVIQTPLAQNGDFRSPECIEILKEADIIITNPPFSLFREYVAQLVEYEKQFLIIGNTNALTYKEIFKLIKDNKLRTGYTNFNVGMYFVVPDDWEKWHKVENGKKLVRVSTSCWFTNLDVTKHHEDIVLYKQYSPDEYPKYDNYDAINVDKVTDIPADYPDAIGVPVTFIDKYNPDQFEIIDAIGRYSMLTGPTPETQGTYLTKVDGRPKYARVIIRNKRLKEAV